MKKLLLSLLMTVFGVSMFAQQGTMAVGVNLSYPMEFKTIGIGARLNYSFTDQIRISPSFNYYLETDGFSAWDINADLHYLFNLGETINVYPLAGVHYTTTSVDWLGISTSGSEFGFNLGGGLGYNLTESLNLGLELKYSIIKDYNQIVPMIYLTYKF